jgi:selenoprotein W-related protein
MTRPRVEIRYCTRCRFMLRAAYLAQELLAAFEQELGEVALVPSAGGILEVVLDGETLVSNRETHGTLEASEVKRLLRDRIAPGRKIGHE